MSRRSQGVIKLYTTGRSGCGVPLFSCACGRVSRVISPIVGPSYPAYPNTEAVIPRPPSNADPEPHPKGGQSRVTCMAPHSIPMAPPTQHPAHLTSPHNTYPITPASSPRSGGYCSIPRTERPKHGPKTHNSDTRPTNSFAGDSKARCRLDADNGENRGSANVPIFSVAQ